jgi:chromatin remodeling complex protein RSC6
VSRKAVPTFHRSVGRDNGAQERAMINPLFSNVSNHGRNIRIAFFPVNRQIKPMVKTSKAVKKVKRTPNAAFMKPVTPDEKLAKVVGDKPLPRTELTKKLWAYIRKNGLQDAKKKTLINADENLKAVFNGKKQVSMFEMTKLVSGHVKK